MCMVNVCVSVFIICMHVMYVIICGSVPMYVCGVWMCTGIYSFKFMYLVACYSGTDTLVWFKLGNGRFEFVPFKNPTHWRFEDRFMKWLGDWYRLIQQRPDDDSNSKPCHFMWVFVLMYCPYLLLPVGVHVDIRIISCDCLIYFTSMITCIT